METIADCTGDPHERTLLVLLPPAFGNPVDFIEHGFVAAVRQRGLSADVIVAGAIADYYLDRSMVDRLHVEVIAPALARGYRSLWLGGISIGGFGTLLYRSRHEQVDGMFLLAPYLGSRPVVNEVLRAGGLAKWEPATSAAQDHEQALLAWLKGALSRDDVAQRILMGYGTDDRFVRSIELLANALPAAQVVRGSGGHDWETWGGLWREMVMRWRLE